VTSGSRSDLETMRASSLLARGYAAALMRVTLSGFWGVTGGKRFRRSGTESRGSERVPTTEVSRQRVSSLIRAAMVAGKKMLPNTQSIEGL